MTEEEVMREVAEILGEAFDKIDALPKFGPPSEAFWTVLYTKEVLVKRSVSIAQRLIDIRED